LTPTFEILDSPEHVTLQVDIINHDQKTISSASKELVINDQHHASLEMTLQHPHLWQGTLDPYLYEVVVKLISKNQVVDSRTIKTGLRYFSFDHESFYLNGIKTRLNGVSRHQDRKDIGNALTSTMHEEDMHLIQEIGANSIRLAHYQQADFFYDLCDEAGMMIWAEIPYISMSSKTDKEGTNALSQMKELIIQNYNHSSIIMWGISNEITIAGKKNNVDEILTKLNTLSHELDPYRVTTMAHVSMLPVNDFQSKLSDVHGYNHYFGWYSGKVEDFSQWLSHYRESNPSRPLSLSEYGVEGIHTLHSETPAVKDYSEEYHALWHEKAYEILENTPYVWGTYVWNMFAFAADFRDEGGSKGMNNKGLVTFDRAIKKDAFYYYKARWTTKPMLHLTQKRFKDRASEHILVKAYSNQNEVTFYVNGELVETVYSSNSVFQTKVTLKMGENTVKVKSGNLEDEATFVRVLEKNTSYEVPAKDKNKGVMNFEMAGNWFDALSEAENPIKIDPNYLSVKNSLHEIMENQQGKMFVEHTFKDFLKHPFFEMLGGMPLEMMREMNKEGFPYGAFFKINEALQKIKKDIKNNN
jgi:beta-galactosidase